MTGRSRFWRRAVSDAVTVCSQEGHMLVVFLRGLEDDDNSDECEIAVEMHHFQPPASADETCITLRLYDDLADTNPANFVDAKQFRLLVPISQLPAVVCLAPGLGVLGSKYGSWNTEQLTDLLRTCYTDMRQKRGVPNLEAGPQDPATAQGAARERPSGTSAGEHEREDGDVNTVIPTADGMTLEDVRSQTRAARAAAQVAAQARNPATAPSAQASNPTSAASGQTPNPAPAPAGQTTVAGDVALQQARMIEALLAASRASAASGQASSSTAVSKPGSGSDAAPAGQATKAPAASGEATSSTADGKLVAGSDATLAGQARKPPATSGQTTISTAVGTPVAGSNAPLAGQATKPSVASGQATISTAVGTPVAGSSSAGVGSAAQVPPPAGKATLPSSQAPKSAKGGDKGHPANGEPILSTQGVDATTGGSQSVATSVVPEVAASNERQAVPRTSEGETKVKPQIASDVCSKVKVDGETTVLKGPHVEKDEGAAAVRKDDEDAELGEPMEQGAGVQSLAGAPQPPTPALPPVAHLQLRLTDGTSLRADFPSDAALHEVRTWVDLNRTDGGEAYSLAIPFPRRLLGPDDMERSLLELELAPRSLLILQPLIRPRRPSASAEGGGWLAYLLSWAAYLNPLAGPASGLGAASQEAGPSSHQQAPGEQAPRRPPARNPNVHGLHGNHDRDEDDPQNKFWNGNSTQFHGRNNDE